MIARLNGIIVEKGNKYAIIEASGVGYKVFTTPQTLSGMQKDEMVQIWTHLAVREISMDLYGFFSRDELDFFELLITISGIGPKGALGILSVADITTLNSAIASGDTSYLTKVSGIGKKSADKIVLELKDKIGVLESDLPTSTLREEVEAVEALKTLGYSHQEARDALKQVDIKTVGTSERVRAALRILGS